MKLFMPAVPPERFHKNFASVLAPFRQAERDLLETWADEFVDFNIRTGGVLNYVRA